MNPEPARGQDVRRAAHLSLLFALFGAWFACVYAVAARTFPTPWRPWNPWPSVGLLAIFALMFGYSRWIKARFGTAPTLPRSAKVIFFVVATSVIPPFVGFICVDSAFEYVGAKSLRDAESEVRAAGFDIDAVPVKTPPDPDDAPYWYLKAADTHGNGRAAEPFLDSHFSEDFFRNASRGVITPSDIARVRQVVESERPTLDLIREGAARKDSDWGIDWNDRNLWEPSNPNEMRLKRIFQLGFVLACRAVIESQQGRQRDAVETIRAGLALARSLSTHGPTLEVTRGETIDDVTLDAAAFVLLHAPPGLAQDRWAPFLHPEELPANLKRALGYQFADSRALLQRPNDPFAKFEAASMLRGELELFRTFDLPYKDSQAGWDAAMARAHRQAWFFADLLFPEYLSHDKVGLDQCAAHMRIAQTAFAAEHFKERTGRWPDATWELRDEPTRAFKAIEDPFLETGKPDDARLLKIIRYGKGILIYSVGPSGRDERGDPRVNIGWAVGV